MSAILKSEKMDGNYNLETAKVQNTLNSHMEKFPLFLKSIMIKSDFNLEETKNQSRKFTQFMFLSLTHLAWKFYHMKQTLAETIRQEEKSVIEQMVRQNDSVKKDAKIIEATKIFETHYPDYFKEVMRAANFSCEECDEKHPMYASIFSKCFPLLCKLLFRYQNDAIRQSKKQEELQSHLRKRKATHYLIDRYPAFLQKMMLNAGYNYNEIQIDDEVFQKFMFLTLYYLTQKLHQLNINIENANLNHEDLIIIKNLREQVKIQRVNSKMTYALEQFDQNYSTSLKKVMVISNYEVQECVETHKSYCSLFLSSLVALCKLHKRDLEKGLQEKKRKLSKSGLEEDINITLDSGSAATKLIETKKNIIYVSSSKKVVIKVMKSSNPHEEDLRKFFNELKTSTMVKHTYLRKAIQETLFETRRALLLDWVDGHPISRLGKCTLSQFFLISREIVSVLVGMHKRHIMHMNLTCDHILYDENLDIVTVIGLGSSKNFESKVEHVSLSDLKDKDVRYVTPEETGKVNREIDYRSDFYSLGIIFYRILTGTYPFENNNPFKVINMHILEDPPSVSDKCANIPFPVSEMVSKLMKKKPEERYQSATGLMHDIDLIISENNSNKNLKEISLGDFDKPDVLTFSKKIFGRDKQFASLNAAFERLTAESFEFAFISGKSGLGKSSLAMELYETVLKKGGYFFCGKFDQRTSKPYSALIEAVENFCDQLNCEDEVTLQRFKLLIQHCLGDEGKILTDAISNLQSLLGVQDSALDVFGDDAKKRFNFVFLKFFKAISSSGPPIVMVIEDIQWVDRESLTFLCNLLDDKSMKNFMFIVTFRTEEIHENHPATDLLHRAKRNKKSFTAITLKEFDEEHVNNFIAHVLNLSPFDCYSLTAHIYSKSKGNPFFISQLLTFLADEGLVYYCKETYKWKWDINSDNNLKVSEDVIELLRKRIISLRNNVQKVLTIASCLGSPFALIILRRIVDCEQSIQDALSSGLLVKNNGDEKQLRFAHDKIQEAAFSLLSQSPKIAYLNLGRKLLKSFSNTELEEHIFIVSSLLYDSTDLVTDQADRLHLALIFSKAGKKALSLTAFKDALKFFDKGIQLLSRDCWKCHYSLSLQLYNAAIEAACCVGAEENLRTYFVEVSNNVSSQRHLIHGRHMQIRFLNDQRKYEEAFQIGIECLKTLKIEFSFQNPRSVVALALKNAMSVCANNSEDIGSLIMMEEGIASEAMTILNVMITTCWYGKQQCLPFVFALMVELTVKYGVSKYSALGFCMLGGALSKMNYEASVQIGKYGLNLFKAAGTKESFPMMNLTYYCLINIYCEPWHSSLNHIKRSYEVCFETGNHELLVNSASVFLSMSYFTAYHLKDALNAIESFEGYKFINRNLFHHVKKIILYLSNNAPNLPVVNVSAKSYEEGQADELGELYRSLFHSMLVVYHLNDIPLAKLLLEQIRQNFHHFKMRSVFPDIFVLYDGLISIRHVQLNKEALDETTKVHIESCINQIKILSDRSPENFLNKYHMMKAEYSILFGNYSEAREYFNLSIFYGNKNKYTHEEGLANERVAMLLLEYYSNLEEEAKQYISKSYKCYLCWGATRMAKNLQKRFKENMIQHEDSLLCLGPGDASSEACISQITVESSFRISDVSKDKDMK